MLWREKKSVSELNTLAYSFIFSGHTACAKKQFHFMYRVCVRSDQGEQRENERERDLYELGITPKSPLYSFDQTSISSESHFIIIKLDHHHHNTKQSESKRAFPVDTACFLNTAHMPFAVLLALYPLMHYVFRFKGETRGDQGNRTRNTRNQSDQQWERRGDGVDLVLYIQRSKKGTEKKG